MDVFELFPLGQDVLWKCQCLSMPPEDRLNMRQGKVLRFTNVALGEDYARARLEVGYHAFRDARLRIFQNVGNCRERPGAQAGAATLCDGGRDYGIDALYRRKVRILNVRKRLAHGVSDRHDAFAGVILAVRGEGCAAT